jgi:hypothetical protein
MALSCSRIVEPFSATNASARRTNSSRPRSNRVLPSSRAISRSTTFCVAMPAWSVPGSHNVSRPRIRSNRTSASWTVLLRPWPMCRMPVTLGGGITMTKGSAGDAGSGVNSRRSSHSW